MILEDAQQAVAAVKRMLDVVRAGGVATTELRAALEQTRVLMAAGAAFQTAAAGLIAARERHGDGGAEVLAVSAGLTQSEAHNQVKTAQVLHKVPKLRDAVQTGEVSQANARRLADVITKTGANSVAGDDELLKQSASLRPEQFGVATRRWITAQQGDNGASEHARQRARRYLKFYDTEDGMIALHGEFDKITGTRIHNRIRHIAGQFFTNDKKLPKSQRRQFPQCMADALDHTTNTPNINTGSETSKRNQNSQNIESVRRFSSESIASSKTRSDQDAVTACGENTDTSSQAEHVNKAGNDQDARTRNGQGAVTGCTENAVTDATTATNDASADAEPAVNNSNENASNGEDGVDVISATASQSVNEASTTTGGENCGVDAVDTADSGEACGTTGGWVADITLVAQVDDATGELIAELSDGTRLPDAVLEELSCNTRWTGLVYDRVGDAIWRSRSRRTVTETQWQTLLTIYGGCFHCGVSPNICQAHHIIPYSQGGATSVKNMVMVCWNCHHNIHHNNWHIETHDDSHHTLHPPDHSKPQPRYGPAHAEDPPPERPARRGRSPSRTQNSRARDPSRDDTASKPRNREESTSRNPTSSGPKSNRKERSPQARDPAPATLW